MTAAAMATTATVEAARTTRRLYPRRFETNAGGADRSVGRTSRSMVRPPLQKEPTPCDRITARKRTGGAVCSAGRPAPGGLEDGWQGFCSGSRGPTAAPEARDKIGSARCLPAAPRPKFLRRSWTALGTSSVPSRRGWRRSKRSSRGSKRPLLPLPARWRRSPRIGTRCTGRCVARSSTPRESCNSLHCHTGPECRESPSGCSCLDRERSNR
jgi:hypothetical protein